MNDVIDVFAKEKASRSVTHVTYNSRHDAALHLALQVLHLQLKHLHLRKTV